MIASKATAEKVGLIGFGAIGRSIADGWADLPKELELVAVCVRPHQFAEARAKLGEQTLVVASVDELLAAAPTLVVEAAGQAVLQAHAHDILQTGSDLYLLSVGALADDRLHRGVLRSAEQFGGQLLIPPGALAGFDGMLALRAHGLSSVVYTSIKPPVAWQGTRAATDYDLDRMRTPTTIFEGSAREAAQYFPKNANLAAAVALAGIGFDETRVKLIADPHTHGNTGKLEALGPSGAMTVEVSGGASPSNPKSSAIVASSVLSSLANRAALLSFV